VKYRTLGKTMFRGSVVGLGTWQLGVEWSKNFTPPDAGRRLRHAQSAVLPSCLPPSAPAYVPTQTRVS